MKRVDGGHEEGEVGAWRRKEKDRRQGEEARLLGRFFRPLRAAGDVFFSTYRALPATWGTTLCLPTRYSANGGFYLHIWATRLSRCVLTRLAARFLPYAFVLFFSFFCSYLEHCCFVFYLSLLSVLASGARARGIRNDHDHRQGKPEYLFWLQRPSHTQS